MYEAAHVYLSARARHEARMNTVVAFSSAKRTRFYGSIGFHSMVAGALRWLTILDTSWRRAEPGGCRPFPILPRATTLPRLSLRSRNYARLESRRAQWPRCTFPVVYDNDDSVVALSVIALEEKYSLRKSEWCFERVSRRTSGATTGTLNGRGIKGGRWVLSSHGYLLLLNLPTHYFNYLINYRLKTVLHNLNGSYQSVDVASFRVVRAGLA